MGHHFLLILAIVSIFATYCQSSGSQLEIDTTHGPIQGFLMNDYPLRAFLGVPYAKPPTGNLRWRRPVEPDTWTAIKETKEFGASCMQDRNAYTPISEDCLYLNVWTSNTTKRQLLPVMVFIYGGSFKHGSSSDALYDPIDLIRGYDYNILGVTLNYRLGSFGFVSNKGLISEDIYGSTGNYGLLDQRLALKWVQNNIQNFGGDPSRVTVFGESAGAASISNHLIMPRSWGLFSQAIIQSGAFAKWTAVNISESENNWNAIAEQVGCTTLKCMRNATAEQIMENYANLPFLPAIDNSEIVEDPIELMYKGDVLKIPLLVGSNKNEGTIFQNEDLKSITKAEFVQMVKQFFPDSSGAVLAEYDVNQYPSPWFALTSIFGDISFTCPAFYTANILSSYVPVYSYYFVHEIDAVSKYSPYLGVFHGSELGFVFNKRNPVFSDAPVPFTQQEIDLAQKFVTWWGDFATFGYPASDPNWIDYTGNGSYVIDMEQHMETDIRDSQCKFWGF
eukprot:TRINITY_DN8308_c0_g1_i1.p1 TRINITY_DN8308_c0_g1~~TRINITY_DN8308_c0_g1_i1.p1  ORF type:complete len:505 (-),score=106.48 TRINITY_DN8308_c0_g1_i1:1074-2588(-)